MIESSLDTIVSKPKLRHSADTTKAVTTKPVLPFTGEDYSSESINSTVRFKMNHEYPEWHKRAACGDKPQEWFFGGEEQPGKQRHRPTLSMPEVKRAKAICHTCPVMMICQTYALENREEFGVWGGTTKRDRDRWWRENGITVMSENHEETQFDTFSESA